MTEIDLDDIQRRMDGAVRSFQQDLAGLRTGRASAGLLEPVTVEAYGAQMPLNQVGTIGVPEPRMLTVQVWDKGLVKAVEKAIIASGLGLNPNTEGQLIRLPLPDLSEERRQELVKVAGKYAEAAKVAIRNVRRDGMETLKKLEKDHEISQDDHHRMGTDIQELTDLHVKEVDEALHAKEQEILQV